MHVHLAIHADYASHHGRDESHVVGDQQDSHGLVQLLENMQNLFSRIGIHVGGRFVQQQQLRIAAEGPGDEHPLLLSPRKGPEGTAFQIVKPHLFQGFPGRSEIFRSIASPGFSLEPPRKHHLQYRYGKGPVEKGVLGSVARPVPAFFGRRAEEKYPSLSGRKEPQGQLEEGGFPASVGAHDAGEFPGAHGEVHFLQNEAVFILEGNILKFQNGRGFFGHLYEAPFGICCVMGPGALFSVSLPWFEDRLCSPGERGRRKALGLLWRRLRFGLFVDRTGVG